MERYSIEKIQCKIYQTTSTNEPVIFEYELAKLLQINVVRLHDKLSTATHIVSQFVVVSDAEYEKIKKIYKYNEIKKKNRYCCVFTKDQIASMRELFQPTEFAYKIIPIIELAFNSLTIPYEDRIKFLIKKKRRKEQQLRWAVIIIGFLIMCGLYVLLSSFINKIILSEFWQKSISVIWFFIEPILASIFSWEKMFNWCSSKYIDEEYNLFNIDLNKKV